MKKCIMHDGGKQMREKAVSRSREHSKDVALCSLFAVVAVGEDRKSTRLNSSH